MLLRLHRDEMLAVMLEIDFLPNDHQGGAGTVLKISSDSANSVISLARSPPGGVHAITSHTNRRKHVFRPSHGNRSPTELKKDQP